MLRSLCFGLALLLISGCASYGVVENAPGQGTTEEQSYSIKTFMYEWRSSENALILAFSGGGTRAAALSYGVLKGLRDTPVLISVNASTDPEPEMDRTNKQPSLKESINAMSDVQRHHHNVATIDLMKRTINRWAEELSTRDRPVTPYFILLTSERSRNPSDVDSSTGPPPVSPSPTSRWIG
jgi:hypothetical protein